MDRICGPYMLNLLYLNRPIGVAPGVVVALAVAVLVGRGRLHADFLVLAGQGIRISWPKKDQFKDHFGISLGQKWLFINHLDHGSQNLIVGSQKQLYSSQKLIIQVPKLTSQ